MRWAFQTACSRRTAKFRLVWHYLAASREQSDLVFRAGYGTYYNGFTGNRAASSIVGLPYWTWESLSLGLRTLQTLGDCMAGRSSELHPAFGGRGAGLEHRRGAYAGMERLGSERTPFNSALDVSYVGVHMNNQVVMQHYNEVPPGDYPDLQAAKPYPAFGQSTCSRTSRHRVTTACRSSGNAALAKDFRSWHLMHSAKNLSDNMPQYETDL